MEYKPFYLFIFRLLPPIFRPKNHWQKSVMSHRNPLFCNASSLPFSSTSPRSVHSLTCISYGYTMHPKRWAIEDSESRDSEDDDFWSFTWTVGGFHDKGTYQFIILQIPWIPTYSNLYSELWNSNFRDQKLLGTGSMAKTHKIVYGVFLGVEKWYHGVIRGLSVVISDDGLDGLTSAKPRPQKC